MPKKIKKWTDTQMKVKDALNMNSGLTAAIFSTLVEGDGNTLQIKEGSDALVVARQFFQGFQENNNQGVENPYDGEHNVNSAIPVTYNLIMSKLETK